jgi:1-acyl-sn-glycerol-3-phosphate acyltransferase
MLKISLGFKVLNSENARAACARARKEGRGILLVSNHESQLDFAYIQCVLMHTFRFFSVVYFVADTASSFRDKRFSWKRHLFGNTFFMNAVGAWAVHRGSREYTISLSDHITILENKGIVGIFPQGGIVDHSKIHGGAGFLAHTLQPVVLPLAIEVSGQNKSITCGTSVLYSEVETRADYASEEERADAYRNFSKKILGL